MKSSPPLLRLLILLACATPVRGHAQSMASSPAAWLQQVQDLLSKAKRPPRERIQVFAWPGASLYLISSEKYRDIRLEAAKSKSVGDSGAALRCRPPAGTYVTVINRTGQHTTVPLDPMPYDFIAEHRGKIYVINVRVGSEQAPVDFRKEVDVQC
jgi:hypothetical protein